MSGQLEREGTTMELSDKRCVPCRGGVPVFGAEEAERLVAQVPGWSLEEDAKGIRREFRFRNFTEAMGFAQRVGELAEAEGHHPDLSIGWGYCTVRFRTHAIRGLHENDFIMAAKVSRLVAS
jgi:4a-hydroxytetrahydrobiopterin dehydratase